MGGALGVHRSGVTLVAALWCCMWGRGREEVMAPVPLSTGFQPLPLLPTIKLGPSGANSWLGGLVHTPGPHGSPEWPLLWGWGSPPPLPQPPRAFSIRGLRLYFPCAGALGWAICFAPAVCPVYLCANVWPQGATLRSACPVVLHSQSGPLGLSARMWGRRVC